MTTAPHGLPCGDTPPTAERLSYRACLSPRPLPQRGVDHIATSPPEEDFHLPKCRSSARALASQSAPDAATAPLHPWTASAPPGDFRRSHLGLTHSLGQKPSVLAKVPPYPGGGLRFPLPTAVSFSTFTTSLTMASAAGRAVQHHRWRSQL